MQEKLTGIGKSGRALAALLAFASLTSSVSAQGYLLPDASGDLPLGDNCAVCIEVIQNTERIGETPADGFCEAFFNGRSASTIQTCNQLIAAAPGQLGGLVASEGCYQYEIYQAKEWVKPCPSHVVCNVLRDAGGLQYCPRPPIDQPFGGGD